MDTFDENDMILPEGFDPALGDQNFVDGQLVDTPVEAAAPTTEPAPVPETHTPTETVTESQTTETAPTTEQTPQVEQPVAPPPVIKVKYNHQDRELQLDEATVLAQKGLNFDKVEQRLKEQEARLAGYEERAKLFGFENADSMMSQAEANFIESRVKDLVDQGNPEALARFLVGQEVDKMRNSIKAQPKAPENTLTPERKQEIEEFSAAYPNVTKIPDEVFKMHADGVRLKTAMDIYEQRAAYTKATAEAKAARDELAILKQNQASAAKAPVTGTVGKVQPETPEQEDPFLKGFDHDDDY